MHTLLLFLRKWSGGPDPLEDPSRSGCFKNATNRKAKGECSRHLLKSVAWVCVCIIITGASAPLSLLCNHTQPVSPPSPPYFTGTRRQPLAGLGALRGRERVSNQSPTLTITANRGPYACRPLSAECVAWYVEERTLETLGTGREGIDDVSSGCRRMSRGRTSRRRVTNTPSVGYVVWRA